MENQIAHPKNPNWIQGYARNVKLEIKPARKGYQIRVGYGLSFEDRVRLLEMLNDAFNKCFSFLNADGGLIHTIISVKSEAFDLLLQIENLIITKAFEKTGSYRPFKGKDRSDAIRTIIKRLSMGVKFRPDLGFESAYFTCRQSISIERKNVYREHVVPVKKLLELIKNRTDIEAFDILDRNLHIALITKQEAQVLDSKLKLKTDMPKNWMDGDSPWARLETGFIETIAIR